MNPYIETLQTYLDQGGEDTASILEMLYLCYREQNPGDTPEIAQDFARLNDLLGELALLDCDRVWDLACKLCNMHERNGFSAGFRVAAQLAVELDKAQETTGRPE